MNRAITTLTVAAAFVVSFAGVSYAQSTAAPEGTIDLLRPIYEAIIGEHYWLAGCLALVAACTALRKWGVKYIPALATDWGAAALVLVGAFAGSLAAGLTTSGTDSVTLGMAWDALKLATSAAGGWTLVSKLIAQPLLNSAWFLKAPAWLQAAARAALWIFVKPPEVRAREAGDAAVAAKPAAGISAVTGEPTEVN